MEPFKDTTWKEYYSLERTRRKGEINEKINRVWDLDDPEVDNILKHDGLLSIPHTHLDNTMEPLIRTARAVHRSGKRKVLAVGLIHAGVQGGEFCLDGLQYILEVSRDLIGLPKIDVEEIYVARDQSVDLNDIDGLVNHGLARSLLLQGKVDDDTAIVITGDLAHYGHIYNWTDVIPDPKDLLLGYITQSLDDLYLKKDLKSYVRSSKVSHSDQVLVGIAVSTILPDNLDYQIFSYTLSDYSDILVVPKPAVVASLFYGVKRRGDRDGERRRVKE